MQTQTVAAMAAAAVLAASCGGSQPDAASDRPDGDASASASTGDGQDLELGSQPEGSESGVVPDRPAGQQAAADPGPAARAAFVEQVRSSDDLQLAYFAPRLDDRLLVDVGLAMCRVMHGDGTLGSELPSLVGRSQDVTMVLVEVTRIAADRLCAPTPGAVVSHTIGAVNEAITAVLHPLFIGAVRDGMGSELPAGMTDQDLVTAGELACARARDGADLEAIGAELQDEYGWDSSSMAELFAVTAHTALCPWHT